MKFWSGYAQWAGTSRKLMGRGDEAATRHVNLFHVEQSARERLLTVKLAKPLKHNQLTVQAAHERVCGAPLELRRKCSHLGERRRPEQKQ